ncbi:hypothetical protein JCM12298_01950 [Desulfothermus naphthae]
MAEDKIFQIKLKALSPISITKREFGILYETYLFIPAWTMWNCLVKLYAIKDENLDYENAEKIFENLRLSNFYILNEADILLHLSDEKKREFISSDLKNAIDTLTNTSLEGALYEREYIIPGTEFVGWVKAENREVINFIEDQLKEKIFFIGADKNTGFGKVNVIEIEDNEDSFLAKEKAQKIIKSIKDPTKDNRCFFPVEWEKDKLFPFVVREWDRDKGSGMKIEYQEV